MKLSYSAATKFTECGKAYEYHYIQKLRPKVQSAALLWGTAIDKGIEASLKGYDGISVFNDLWKCQYINGIKTNLSTCIDISYSSSDLDLDVLDDKDFVLIKNYKAIKEELKTNDNVLNKISEIINKKEKYTGFKNLPEEEKLFINYVFWLSLRKKGEIIIQSFNNKIKPKIKKVYSTQEEVKLENEIGDSIIGYADLVCEFDGYDKPVIIDFKTSSIPYEADSVITSPQLSLYLHALSEKYNNTRYCGYIVFYKRLDKEKLKICKLCGSDGTGKRHKTCDNIVDNKRCNGEWNETIKFDVSIDVIIDTIPTRTESIILEKMDDVNTLIKQGIFTRNFLACKKAWGVCPYFNKCFYDKDDDLIVVEK
jgi:hypothetical protein